MSTENVTAVAIVGGGPVGLSLAIELGLRGVRCLLFEKSDRDGWSPRAKTTHTRTRGFLRRWGIAGDLAEAAPFGIDYPSHIHFVTRLGGYGLARFDDAMNCRPARDARFPEHSQWIPQYKLEAVLREKARALASVGLRMGAEVTGLRQSGDKVLLDLRIAGSDASETIEADYVIGADGARSVVREEIGVKMVGSRGAAALQNFVIRAPGLAQAHRHGPGVIFWHINPETPGIWCNMDEGDLWSFGPTTAQGADPLTDEEVVALARRSTGIDLPYEVLWRDSWRPSRALADHYRKDRVFLAGDACHLHPPFGGFGMNMGIADAVDLGWKLAAVLQGWGGAALLDSYEIERRPLHEEVLKEADRNFAVLPSQLFRAGIEEDTPDGAAIRAEVGDLIERTKRDEFYALGVLLGLRCRSSPVVAEDGSEGSWTMSRDYVPSAAPGSLAPHAWLADGRSLYDAFGSGFTLLVLRDHHGPDVGRARAEAERIGVPLDVVLLSEPDLDALYEAGRALVRPDQIVAWRGDEWPASGLLAFAAGLAPSAPERTVAVEGVG